MNVDLDLAEGAAEDRGGGKTFNAGQLVADGVVGEVEQLTVVAAVAGDDQVTDGNGGASYLRMVGGNIPGGMNCISPLTSEMTWLAATSGSTTGRKKTLMMPMPRSEGDSMCSRWSQRVSARSRTAVTLRSMSGAGMPRRRRRRRRRALHRRQDVGGSAE